MKVDISGQYPHLVVRDAETKEEVEGVKAVTLYLCPDGIWEASIYVSPWHLDLRAVPRGPDGVRDSGIMYAPPSKE